MRPRSGERVHGTRNGISSGGWMPASATATSSSRPSSSSGRSSSRGVRSTRSCSGHGSVMAGRVPDGARPGERLASGPMHAITVREPGGPEVLEWTEVPDPVAGPGEVLVDVVASRGQPGRPAAAPGPLPAAAGRVGDHRAGVLRADRRARRGRRPAGGRRRGVRAAGRRRVRRAGRGAGRAAAAGPGRGGPGDRRRAARGGLHGLVERGRGRPALRPARRSSCRAAAAASARTPSRWPRRSAPGWRPPPAPRTGCERCRELGADIVIDYHDDIPAELKKATDGHGADVILDNMGAKGLAANVDALAPDGRLLIIGMQGGAKAELNLGKLLRKRASVTAMGLRGRPVDGPNGKAAVVAGVREQVWPMLADGRVRPIVHGTVPDGRGRPGGAPAARGGRRRRQAGPGACGSSSAAVPLPWRRSKWRILGTWRACSRNRATNGEQQVLVVGPDGRPVGMAQVPQPATGTTAEQGVGNDGRAAGQGHADRHDDQAAARGGARRTARRRQPHPAARRSTSTRSRSSSRASPPSCATSSNG